MTLPWRPLAMLLSATTALLKLFRGRPSRPSAAPEPVGEILVVGVGGRGGNTIRRLATMKDSLPHVRRLALNADLQDLDGVSEAGKLAIGIEQTNALGCGGDPALGAKVAENERARIREALQGSRVVVVIVGLGGGFGTGAAPIVAREAGAAGAIVIAVASLPFPFEGSMKRRQAEQGLSALRMEADVIVATPNVRALDSAPGASMEAAFETFDRLSLPPLLKALSGNGSREAVIMAVLKALDGAEPGRQANAVA